MHKKPNNKLVIDSVVPVRRSIGVTRNPKFPDVGKTISPYHYNADRKHRYTDKPKKKRSKKKIILFVLLPFILIGLWLGGKFALNLSKIFDGNIFGVFNSAQLRGEDEGRVNILLAGNSADDVGHNGGSLTDSVMVVSINTKNNSAVILSIPRDLYVEVPGYGHSKINEAFVDGERSGFNESGYPEGGMGLLQKTVYETLGIKTHYYALVNYSAFRDAVNAVGGIDVNIQSTNSRGLYDPSTDWATGEPLVDLTNGVHHLNGQQALNLSRARGDAYGSYGFANSDFTRTSNQRIMMLSLKQKVFSSGVLANPVKLSNLSDAIGKNVKTDFSLSEVRRLYEVMQNINNNEIKSVGLNDINGVNYLASYRNSKGQSTLIPSAGLDDFSEIKQVLRRLLSNNPLVREAASVVVLNATDVNGVATNNKELLEAKGIQVTDISDALANRDISQIIVATEGKKPKTLAALQALYGNSTTTVNPYSRQYPDADFIVLVGQDKSR